MTLYLSLNFGTTTDLTLLFSGDLFEEKRRKGRPVEARQGRNELE